MGGGGGVTLSFYHINMDTDTERPEGMKGR